MTDVLKQTYIRLVEFLSNILGENYEVVLHEISPQNSSIIAIKNSHISGRDIGAPLTDYALNIIQSKQYKSSDFSLNYKAKARDKEIKGSTFFIKENGELVGMLCINHDEKNAKDAILNLSAILGLECSFDDNKIVSQETLSASVEEMITQLVPDEVKSVSNGINLNATQKEEVILKLYQNNIFSIKSAVSVASKMLKISEPTLYRYLKNIKN